jgi:hypothetical protein
MVGVAGAAARLVSPWGVKTNVEAVVTPVIPTCTVDVQVFAETSVVLTVVGTVAEVPASVT